MEKRTFNFWDIFRSANLTLLKEKNNWLVISGGPWLLVFIAFVMTVAFGIDPNASDDLSQDMTATTGLSLLLSFLLNFVALVILQIRILRYNLFNELPQSFISLEWKMRHWKMIGNSILIGFAVAIPAGILFGIGAYFTATDSLGLGIVLFLLAFISLVYIATRFYLFAPVVAMDGAHPLKTSWRLTAGWTWLKFLALLIIVSLPVAIVLNIISMLLGMTINMWIHVAINSLFSVFVLNIIVTSAIASVYKQLSTE